VVLAILLPLPVYFSGTSAFGAAQMGELTENIMEKSMQVRTSLSGACPI
jgi:hypothetical protein